MPCRPWARLRDRRRDRRGPDHRRAEHRPFPDRRSDLRRARQCDPPHARIDGAGPHERARRQDRVIIGIGSDLSDIRRIERTLERYGEKFIARIFTDEERRRSERRANRAASYAKRYSAKEACSKALGTGFRRGVYWRDLGVVNLASGQPTLVLTNGALERLKSMVP